MIGLRRQIHVFLILGFLLALTLVALPASAEGSARTIRLSHGWISALGDWHVGASGTQAASYRALGDPDWSYSYDGDRVSKARWDWLGLTLQYECFCADGPMLTQTAAIRGHAGRVNWRTSRGLRVGDSVARLRRLYPHAVRKGTSYTLAQLYNTYGSGPLPVLTARTSHRRVSSLILWIGKGGD